MDKNLTDLKSNMEKQLANYRSNLSIAQSTYQQKIGTATEVIRGAPIAEKELMDKTRFQNIKEQLYLTLLQKREEAAIAKASVTVNTKILTPPLKMNASLTPSHSKILFTSVLIGLILPIIFAIFKEVLNRKIISKKQLQGMTNIPVLAELEQADSTENFPFIIEGNSRSMFGEQIRSLRTNIDFYLNAAKPVNYVIITSSVSGEGKSFLSMNIAKSYSLQGKRVALLEFDLRRPKIHKALNMSDVKIGLTSFLMGKYKCEEMVTPINSKPEEKFDLFPSGPIPPNPQELVSNDNMKILKEYLDANYDIVIVDTPPFGIVADAQILGRWADLTLIVTRFQQTVREQVQEINEWNDRGLFKSMGIVFNGVKNSGYFGYKYGYYYYKRKYGYNYYSSAETEKKV
jgi:capsular exopolysaccharide synthesis family protein